ncbi:MAG: flagellar basal body P-ring formation chaperone FlgA [bacterium]
MPERLIIIAAIFIITGLCLSGRAIAAELLSLELPGSIELDGSSYTVGDVVSSHSGREDFWQAIRAEELGSLHGASSTVLDPQAMLATLAARGYDWRLIGLSGAREVRISRRGCVVSAQRIREFIEAEVSLNLGCDLSLIEKPGQAIEDIHVNEADCSLRLGYTAESAGSLPVSVEVVSNGRVLQSLMLARVLDFRVPAVRTLVALSRDMTLDGSILAAEATDCRPGMSICTDPQLITGLVATRSLPAGSLISPELLRRPWDVQRRELVQLVYSGSGLSCSAEAEAMADGRTGDTITVRRTEDGEKFLATIIAAGKVEIR